MIPAPWSINLFSPLRRRTVAEDLMRLNGLAPKTPEEATLFAQRYVEPEKRDEYLEHHRGGGTLWDWYIASDEDWQDAVFMDNLCVPCGYNGLPYAERLEVIAQERARFDAWRAQREVEVDHVC